MKVSKAIKKMVALGIGSTMLGATVLGAMAADLSEYPTPFVSNGVFDALIVVGESAAAMDVVGSVDIATSLQYSMGQAAGAAGAGGVAVSGDAAQIESSGDMLELNEPLGNVTEVLTDSDLKALADGQITNEEGTFSYSQYIRFDRSVNELVDFTLDDNDESDIPADYLYIANGVDIYEYELSFATACESDVVTEKLDDLEMKKITMIGKEFTITDTKATEAGQNIEITLMGGEMRDTMEEGETKTYNVHGVEYEVTATIVSDILQKAKFTVNGEVTDEMMDDDTYTLSDGTVFGILSILPNEAGDVTQDLVDLYLGAEKIKLADTNITQDGDGEQELEVNEEEIDGTEVMIRGTTNGAGDLVRLARIKINANAQDDIWVPAGSTVSAELEEPQAMFTSNWDIAYEGLSDVAVNNIEVKPSGDDKYNFIFKNMDGDEIKLPWLFQNASSLNLGKELGKELVLNEAINISKNQYFLVGSDGDGDDAYTHALQYKGYDAGDKVMTFNDLGTSDSLKVTHTNASNGALILSGKEFGILVGGSDDSPITVDMNDDNVWTNGLPNVVALGGAKVVLLNYTYQIGGSAGKNATNISVTIDATKIDTTDADETVWAVIKGDTAEEEVDVDSSVLLNSGGVLKALTLIQVGDEDNYEEMTQYGTLVRREESSTGPDTLLIGVPEEQIEPLVYVTAGTVSSSRVVGGGEAVTITQIEVGAAVLDKEVADVGAQNLIVVGGPCADSVAAELLGNPEDCTEGFVEGEAKIKLIPQATGKVALLVAGYNAMDTRAACRVLANHGDYQLTGQEVKVTYTSLDAITVSAPTVE